MYNTFFNELRAKFYLKPRMFRPSSLLLPANFRFPKISPMQIFIQAKFHQLLFWRNFAKNTVKFRLT